MAGCYRLQSARFAYGKFQSTGKVTLLIVIIAANSTFAACQMASSCYNVNRNWERIVCLRLGRFRQLLVQTTAIDAGMIRAWDALHLRIEAREQSFQNPNLWVLMMNEIQIQGEDRPELRFEGQLIAESRFEVDLDDEYDRSFVLQVYAIDGGGFVSTLRYATTSIAEKANFWYEDMDQFKDVENFFYVFEANEVIKGFGQLNRNDREKANLVCKRVAKRYESSMFKFLDLVRRRAIQQKFGDRMIEKSTGSSLLRALGLKR